MALTNRGKLFHSFYRYSVLSRSLSTNAASFAEMYRESVSSVPVPSGTNLVGHVVGQRRPRSTSSQFSVVDFGLKSEAPFAPGEVAGVSSVGDPVARRVVDLEDDFNEPSFDHDQRSELPSVQAERYRALVSAPGDQPQFVYGRLSSFKRGGASAKVLGFDAFSPRHHVLAIKKPTVGSYAPFFLLSFASSKRSSPQGLPGLEVNPVVSSYGGIMFTLANLVGFDDAWEASGGGSEKERLAYLRLLTRVLYQKNNALRSAMPKVSSTSDSRNTTRRFSSRNPGESPGDQAANALRWLDRPDFPGVWEHRQKNRTAVGGSWGRLSQVPHSPLPPPRVGARRASERPALAKRPRIRRAPKEKHDSDSERTPSNQE